MIQPMTIVFISFSAIAWSSLWMGQPVQQSANMDKTIHVDGQEYSLVYSDEFENGSDRWEFMDEKTWSLRTDGRNHTLGIMSRRSEYQPKYRSPYHVALLKERSFDDVVIEFDVKSTKDTGDHRDCCVFFGYQDPENFYYVHLGAKPDPHSGQIMLVENSPRRALTKNKNHVPWTLGWHKVRVLFHSETGKIRIYFDDFKKPIMSVTDQTFKHGKIGIGSFDDMNEFDNVRIYSR